MNKSLALPKSSIPVGTPPLIDLSSIMVLSQSVHAD